MSGFTILRKIDIEESPGTIPESSLGSSLIFLSDQIQDQVMGSCQS